MRQSLQKYCTLHGHLMNDVYVWLDILSIPQRHPAVKRIAVDSLYTYASAVDALIIIAPDSMHKQLKTKADLQTYKSRAWCRVEQIAHLSVHDLTTMFIGVEEGELQSVAEHWMEDVVRLFEADMTCCRLKHKSRPICDRETLVVPLLGLYCTLLLDHSSPGARRLYELICKQKNKVFPPHFQFVTERGAERRVLFGDLIPRLERLVASGQANLWVQELRSVISEGRRMSAIKSESLLSRLSSRQSATGEGHELADAWDAKRNDPRVEQRSEPQESKAELHCPSEQLYLRL